MKKLIIINIVAIIYSISLLIPNHLFGQTISQTSINAYGKATAQGQSFTATRTGYVMKIEVRADVYEMDATLYMYNGANGSGIFDDVGTPAYTQTGVHINKNATTLITFDVPFPIIQGNQYSFIFLDDLYPGGNSTYFGQTNTNPYAGGTRLSYFSLSSSNDDLYFKIWESTTIPTLTEWAAITLGVLLAGFGVFIIRNRLL